MKIWNLIGENEIKHAIAICSFKHENTNTLSFKIGDRLELKEECEEWYRGFLVRNPCKWGIFPKSYVKLFDPKLLLHSDPSVYEIESILKEWTSIWSKKYEECEKKKKTHCLMGFFKNVLNLKNVIVENRASIDEIKELKKSTISKILQGNSLLGLDVIAFDSNYNKLDASDTTTIVLYEELKKNSDFKNQSLQMHLISQSSIKEEQINETNLSHFHHKSSMPTGNSSSSRTSPTYCLQLSLFNLVPSANFVSYTDENAELCVNLFFYRENMPESSYYLCENASFNLSEISSRFSVNMSNGAASSSASAANGTSTSNVSLNQFLGGKLALFCDISEKDFELTKNGYKLFLVAYAVRHTKHNAADRHSSIGRIFAGGIYDLGSNLYNIFYVTADVRNIQSSMVLNIGEFENSIVTPRTLQELINLKDSNDNAKSGGKGGSSKDAYLTLTFKTELSELSFKNAYEKYEHLAPRICRKMDFPEIIMPDDFRNDFYVTVMGGEFQKARNYEFIVNLVQFKEDGSKVNEIPVDFSEEITTTTTSPTKNDLTNGKNSPPTRKYYFYKSLVYPKQDKPKWNEIVNVSIPHGKKVEEIKKTYLRFLIRNRSLDGKDKTKIVGVCYLQITNEDGSAIKDTRFHLPMIRIDSESDSNLIDGYFYSLKACFNQSKLHNINSPSTNNDKIKDFIDVKVKVVSTQLTQNVTLLNLLSFPTDVKPNSEKYQSLLTYLDELLSVKEEQSAEIVKFLQAILDKIIDILLDLKTKIVAKETSVSPSVDKAYEMHSKQIQPRVFEILVAIFQIIENQSKFASFRTVIDAYLSKNFCITLAHKPLLRIFTEIISNIYDKYFAYNQSTTPQISNSNSNIFLTPSLPKTLSNQNSNRFSEYASLSSGSNLLSGVQEERENENALNAIKSIEYIFKFAFRSRELLSLYNKSNNLQSDLKGDTFDTDIANIFAKLNDITNLNLKYSNNMFDASHSSIEANLTKIQSFILKNVISLMPILINSKRYSISKISEFYIGFLNSRYILQTQFLSKFIRTRLFEHQDGRHVLIQPLCQAISNLITIDNRNEDKSKNDSKLELVGKVLAELMDVLEKKNIGNVSNDMNEISLMLFKFSNIFLYFKQNQENRQLYGSILISIMRLMDASHYEIFFQSVCEFANDKTIECFLEENKSIIDENIINSLVDMKNMTFHDTVAQLIVMQMIFTCKSLMDENTFPKDWFDLLILRNSVIQNALYHIAERINQFHIEDFSRTNKQIWFDYFDCIVQLASDPCLQLERFNETKRNGVLLKYQDMRIKAAVEIKKMWYNLGDRKHEFIPKMVEPFMKVALIPLNEIHNSIIPVFFDMINSEHMLKGLSVDFDDYVVPRELITNLDIRIALGYGDCKFRNAFEKIMTEKFNNHVNLKNNVKFVKNFVDLYDLLTEYGDLKEDSCDELKTFYLNEILTFYGYLKRFDIYVKYVEILRQIHKSCKNPVCAAYTLKLHAELLFWSNDPLEPYLTHPSYPNQYLHKNLKELLFIEMIDDFTQGQAWEKALELSKILRGIYDSQYELEKLYKFLRKQADLCENIIKVERYECKYYLVGLFGRGFSPLLRNKQFVFRSEQLEQIMTFRQRVESWFPKASRISHSNPPSELEMNSENQYIQIISVQPVYEQKEHLKGLNLNAQILKYYHHNEVNKFKFTYRKDTKLIEDDPTLWWLKEKILVISNQLPDVINFYPVTSEITVDISPIQNAVNTVKERLDKLKSVCSKIETTREVAETDKSLIQGTIDAGVLGGLPKYKKFFAESFLEANPEYSVLVAELKTLITDTINWGESFLDLSLEFLPNDDLLSILKREQLPKLKTLFDMPLQPTMRRKPAAHTTSMQQVNNQLSVESTPKSTSKHSFSLNESTSSNKSFLKQITQVENYSGRALLSYLVGDKNSSNQLSMASSNSHRDSISSIKSNNSDEEAAKTKIVLDETVNPKRPLRPNRVTTQNSTSSPSNSNQSSRPISHLSGEELSSVSMQQINNSLTSSKFNNHLTHDEIDELDLTVKNGTSQQPPPPKPPKPVNLKFKFNNHNGSSQTAHSANGQTPVGINSQSSEDLLQAEPTYDQGKSSSSLNSIQFGYLSAKTTSDSILNRVNQPDY